MKDRTPVEEALPSTSLDPQETSHTPFDDFAQADDHPLDLQSTHQLIAHRHHEGPRRRIVDALHRSPDNEDRRRARRLAACCCCPTFRTSPDNPIAVSLARCRDRLCPLCCRRRGVQAAAKILTITRSFDAPRLITLTLKATPATLKDRLWQLFNRFGLLRTKAGWRDRVRGGVWALEVTRNATSDQWHAHLHIIADGAYFPQPVLKALWHDVTGDSYIVDVRAIHDRGEAARYVSAYLGKPPDLSTWPEEAIREYATATKGRRMMQPFGTARNVEIDDDQDSERDVPPRHLCTAHTLLAACVQGYEPALRAREIIARLGIDHAIAAAVQPPTVQGTAAPVQDWELVVAVQVLEDLNTHAPDLPPPPKGTVRVSVNSAGPPSIPDLYSV